MPKKYSREWKPVHSERKNMKGEHDVPRRHIHIPVSQEGSKERSDAMYSDNRTCCLCCPPRADRHRIPFDPLPRGSWSASGLITRPAAYAHDATWGDANGYSHLRASLLGPSLTIPFVDKKLCLGTWQQIIFLDFDNRSRSRRIALQFIGE